jgi:uncharacterized DUF497 family protein
VAVRFSWDPFKAAGNLRKHGVSFREAMTAFEDTLSVTVADPDHSTKEMRFILVGVSVWQRLLVVRPRRLRRRDPDHWRARRQSPREEAI